MNPSKSFRTHFSIGIYRKAGLCIIAIRPIGRIYMKKVYSATADVSLFWKTNMLYYVKSDVNYENVELKLSEQNKDYRVKIDLDDLAQNSSSNELSNLVSL